MAYKKQIVCFANSYKHGGYCVAGKEWVNGQPGKWVRPIGPNPQKPSISKKEQTLDTGDDLRLLDIVSIPFTEPKPDSYQTENHLVAAGCWEYEGRLKWEDIPAWRDSPPQLWGLGHESSDRENNCVPKKGEFYEGEESLFLIHLDAMKICFDSKEAGSYTKHFVRAEFDYRDAPYRMDVTDPQAKKECLARRESWHKKNLYACISLTAPYEKDRHRRYKLISSIIEEGRAR